MGSGGTLGRLLVESPKIDAISFTGSLLVGKSIAAAAIADLTKLQMEMGAKNALAVMDDGDLDLAVSAALGGAFGGSGQKCTASSRLVVHERIHDAFVERLVAGAQALKVGHALAAGTEIGPVVSAEQLESNVAYLALAKKERATAVRGNAAGASDKGLLHGPGGDRRKHKRHENQPRGDVRTDRLRH